ncbi:collagen alpha-1(XV) chain-like [Sarcoptes scabiei]|nr:collagen alpha-1(XV) chain-like [Sarcoptes scabiei]
MSKMALLMPLSPKKYRDYQTDLHFDVDRFQLGLPRIHLVRFRYESLAVKRLNRKRKFPFCLLLFSVLLGISILMIVANQILLSSKIISFYNCSIPSASSLLVKLDHVLPKISKIFHSSLSSSSSSVYSFQKYLRQLNSTLNQINDRLLSNHQELIDWREEWERYDQRSMRENFEDYWQPIRSSNKKFFTFSAYIDSFNRSNLWNRFDSSTDDPEYFIRIIAVTVLNTREQIIGCFDRIDRAEKNFHTKTLKFCHCYRQCWMRPIREHWYLKYSAFFLYCPIPLNWIDWEWERNNRTKIIRIQNGYISLLTINQFRQQPDLQFDDFIQNKQNLLKLIVPSSRLFIHSMRIEIREPNREQKHHLAVCVKPLHYHWDKSLNLIEFIEFKRLLGVERFYFYNHTVGFDVDQTLRLYRKFEPRLIEIIPWWLPIKSQTEIRTEGIFASLNDCLYRAKQEGFDLIMFIDLDEFIIPNQHQTLIEMIESVEKFYPEKIGAFSFRNGFFYLQFPSDRMESILDENNRKQLASKLVVLSKTLRKSELNIHKQRSKCIVKAEFTIEMGNHFVWEFQLHRKMLNIDQRIAYLHHYRVCEFGGDGCILKSDHQLDRRCYHWAPKLIESVSNRLESFCSHQSKLDSCRLISPSSSYFTNDSIILSDINSNPYDDDE